MSAARALFNGPQGVFNVLVIELPYADHHDAPCVEGEAIGGIRGAVAIRPVDTSVETCTSAAFIRVVCALSLAGFNAPLADAFRPLLLDEGTGRIRPGDDGRFLMDMAPAIAARNACFCL